MRIGHNPNVNKKSSSLGFHKVIIPVYIPNQQDYYKDAFQIFKLCVSSLIKTVNKETYITLVNNGCCIEVADYLNELLREHKVHEVIHTSNIGKINAVLKGIAGNSFHFTTVADSDVLFLNGWQQETFKVFENFKKAGVVGVVPQFKLYENLSANLIFDNLFSKKLCFSKVEEPEALKKFYKSIGWKDDYNKDYLKYHLTLSNKYDASAVVGAGHFIATYSKQVIDIMPKEDAMFKIRGNTERMYLDKPVLSIGKWRLTTERNYAYHLGNTYEDWMGKKVALLKNEAHSNLTIPKLSKSRITIVEYFVKNRIFRKLFSIRILNKWFLRYKGLPKSMIDNY